MDGGKVIWKSLYFLFNVAVNLKWSLKNRALLREKKKRESRSICSINNFEKDSREADSEQTKLAFPPALS